MISSRQYRVLKLFCINTEKNKLILPKYYRICTDLTNLQLLIRQEANPKNGLHTHDFYLTDQGISAYEEYRRSFWKIKKENLALFFSFVAIIISIIALIVKAS